MRNEIVDRSYQFSLRVIRLVGSLPKNEVCKVIGRQLLRSGTSIGANVEEAQSGYSKNDFTNKMNIAQKEARESKYWLRLIRDSKQVDGQSIEDLINESDAITKILFSIVKTSRKTTNN
jgi:four helix bundle protein